MPLVLVWPLICVALGALLWLTMLVKLDDERVALQKNALKEATSLARAYSQNLTRSIEKIDQISLLVKYEWERSRHTLKLEELLQKGVFPKSQFTLVTIIDHTGMPVTATLPMTGPINAADREYFLLHKARRSSDLYVSKPSLGRFSKKVVIQFTRRLETEDGAFDGVILVSVEPAYFSSFYDGSNLGKTGFLGVLGQDGALRMSGIGGAVSNPVAPALRATPALATAEGSALFDGNQWFSDRRARFVAWDTMEPYPLIALAGLSSEEVFAAHQDTWIQNRNIAIAGSIFLLFSALVAIWLSMRIASGKLQEEEVRHAYRVATEGGNEGFYMLRALRDKAGTIIDFEVVDCNERGATFYGLTRAQFVGQKSSVLNTASYFQVVMKTYCKAMALGFYEDELHVPPDSPLRIEWIRRRIVRSGNGLAITLRDISEAKTHQRELARMANEDALTALPNRNWLTNFLPLALQAANDKSSMLALLFIDLDEFKKVNDSLGHSAGDELLQIAASRLIAALRQDDRAVRLGGDEFTVVLDPIAHENDAAMVAARIIKSFNEPFQLAHGQDSVGASIGISIYPRDGSDAEALLKHADIAMYYAKSAGKAHYRFYEPSFSEDLKARHDMKRALQRAIEHNQFVMFYQPRVDTVSGELRGLEALVRWLHPKRGMVPPLEFIALAEETGLILKLGELVLELVCAQIAEWRAQDLPLVPVSINVSPRQFNHGDIKNLFAASIARHRLDAALIDIEITESSMMGEEAEVAAELAALRKLGITLLVDDFGTGYSSLSQLQRLDMDVLKVDRAFTAELGKTAEGEVFFRAIVSMAHALGMSVVAEGVETHEQLCVLQTLACDEIQGYYISRPVPAGEVPALLHKRYLMPAPATTALN